MMKGRNLLKRAALFTCTAVMAASLTACGGAKKDSSAGAAAENTVKFAIPAWWSDWGSQLVADYKKANPDANVELIEIASGEDMYTKITMMLQSSQTAPDIFSEDGFMLKSDAAAGYLEPLDDRLKDWEDWSQFEEAIIDGAKGSDGKQYAVPFSTDTQGIWYDKELFKQAGLPVPFEPKTWAEILEAGEKIKTLGDDITPIFMYASKTTPEETSMRTFQSLYSGTGAELYDEKEGKWVVDKTALTTTLGFVNDVFHVRGIGPSLSLVTTNNVESIFQSQMFKNHQLGMLFSGHWILNKWGEGKDYEWPEALEQLGFAKLPTVAGSGEGYTTMCGGWTWAIPKNANNKEGAMKFLKFIASKEQQAKFSLTNGDLAVRKDVLESEEYKNQKMALPKETTDMLQYGHFRPTVEGYSSVTPLYTEMIENVAMTGMSVDDAINSFETQLKATVGEDKVLVK
ncbi:extracellular solute-binding protein [Lacrimispora brassicae]